MTKRHITPHKGGRYARIPGGRIRQQTLDRIHAEMRERGKSWADLVEEKFSGGNEMEKQNAFNGEYYEVWINYGKKEAHCISKSTYAMSKADAIKKATAAAPAGLDISKVTAHKV